MWKSIQPSVLGKYGVDVVLQQCSLIVVQSFGMASVTDWCQITTPPCTVCTNSISQHPSLPEALKRRRYYQKKKREKVKDSEKVNSDCGTQWCTATRIFSKSLSATVTEQITVGKYDFEHPWQFQLQFHFMKDSVWCRTSVYMHHKARMRTVVRYTPHHLSQPFDKRGCSLPISTANLSSRQWM